MFRLRIDHQPDSPDLLKALCVAIIIQAKTDFEVLQTKGVPLVETRSEGVYSISDIESFLKNDWCDKILEFVGVNFTGNDLLIKFKGD